MTPKQETVYTSTVSPHNEPLGTGTPSGPASQPIHNTEELQYLDLVRDILQRGEHRPDRCAPWI